MTARRVVVIVLSVIAVVAWRTVGATRGMPNVEIVTAVSLGMAFYLRDARAAVIPLIAVGMSDLLLGFGSIMAFTWSAWAVTALAACSVARRTPAAVGTSIVFAVSSSTWFYLWTNAGVWILGRGTAYPAGAEGLGHSLLAGLPFFRNMVVANLVLVPCAVAILDRLRSLDDMDSIGRQPVLAGHARLTGM
jgi:hypothetical protein